MKQIRLGMGGKGIISLEIAVRAISAGVDDALGNSLVIEMEDLLAKMEVIHHERPARTDPKRILVVCNWSPLSGRQNGFVAGGNLVQLATCSPDKLLVMDGGGNGRGGIWFSGHVSSCKALTRDHGGTRPLEDGRSRQIAERR
ncbi:hypothetical protein AGR8A_pAt10001 [Agrobacterium fabrum str. J-07]|nr:hypothetical protein AGR8A_pAt10001 [Agrobacterium fabrum str. J-07]